MKDYDEAVMVCVDADAAVKLEGYQTNCSGCDKPIWVSYSSSEMLTEVHKLVCFECFIKMKPDEFDIAPPDAIQAKEISKATGLTKEQVAKLPDILRAYIKQYEQGKIQLPGGIPSGTGSTPPERR